MMMPHCIVNGTQARVTALPVARAPDAVYRNNAILARVLA
jgi:hypothetical protein